jgi:hypothetical protein
MSSSSSSPSSSSSSNSSRKKEEEAAAEIKRRKEMQEKPVSLAVTPPLSEDEKAPPQQLQQQPQQPSQPEPASQPPSPIEQSQPPQQQQQQQQQTTVTKRDMEEDLQLFPQRLVNAPATEGEQKSAFGNAIDRDYRRALEEGITKALDKVSRRFSMMLSQERNPMDVARDALGNDTDYYENLMDAIRSGDPSAGSTLEDVYLRLYNLAFTEMRSLDAIKQQYYPP